MKEWRVGRNKPGNKAAQTVGKNFQNLFNTGELVVQGYSEEITSKVQKYARMSANTVCVLQLWRIDHRKHQRNLYQTFHTSISTWQNVACDVLAVDQLPSCVFMSQISDLRCDSLQVHQSCR